MRLVAALFALTLLAGCFAKDGSPDSRTFEATGGKASMGWAYDGAGLVPASATLDGMLEDAANTGIVNVSFELGGSKWIVVFDTFTQAAGKTFQDGGVEIDLDEHGDTGVADTTIPKIRALAAAWGTATLLRDGAPTAAQPWSAHLMLSADTVRGTDGKITKADGTTPYDPNAAGDARRIEGDPQVIFWIKHPQGETYARAPEPVAATLSCQGAPCGSSVELAIPMGAAVLALNFTVTGPAVPAPVPLGPVGQGQFTILDANGTELTRGDVAPSPGGPTVVVADPIPLLGVAFPLTLSLTGSGAFDVQADGTASFSDIPFIVLTWDDVTYT